MRNYIDPEMKVSKFSLTDIVTTSEGVTEDANLSNIENAQNYLQAKGIELNNIIEFN